MSKHSKLEARRRRHMRVRKKISGTAARPRMAVFISNKHMYVQFIDDEARRTVASASTLSKEFLESGKGDTVAGAAVLGKLASAAAAAAGVTAVVFDRGGFTYHGKVKAIAESAREGGLKF